MKKRWKDALSFMECIFLPETCFSSVVLPGRTGSPVQNYSVWKAARTTLLFFDFSFLLIKPRPFSVIILNLLLFLNISFPFCSAPQAAVSLGWDLRTAARIDSWRQGNKLMVSGCIQGELQTEMRGFQWLIINTISISELMLDLVH